MATSTGTFVSCKDYDDDISGLQGDINSTKTSLEEKVKAVETSIAALATIKTELETAIAAAKDDAEKAVLAAQEAAIAAASAELATAKAEIMALVSANEQDIEVLNEKVAAIEVDLAGITGQLSVLSTFQSTTEKALSDLLDANEKLDGTIGLIDSKVKENATAIGSNLKAIETQKKALEEYEKVAAGELTAVIDGLTKKLNDEIERLEGLIPEDTEGTAAALKYLKEVTLPALEKEIEAKFDAKLNLLALDVKSMITGVKIESMPLLSFSTAVSLVDYSFAEGVEGIINFKKGDVAPFGNSEITISVTPTSAKLKEDGSQISLMNSQLGDLSEFVEITSVEPYTDLMTTATKAESKNGLWTVNFKLKENFNNEAFTKAIQKDTKDIKFALAITTDAAQAGTEISPESSERKVLSGYDILVKNSEKDASYAALDFSLTTAGTNKKSIGDVRNRSFKTEQGSNNKLTPDQIWDGIPNWDGKDNVTNKPATVDGDERDHNPAYPIEIGKSFTVTLDSDEAKGIRSFYVELDTRVAVEGASELAAWTAYSIDGLKKMVEVVDGKATLDIIVNNGVSAVEPGEHIAFRLWAVNYNGTLVDPDGKSFTVTCGKELDGAKFDFELKGEAGGELSKPNIELTGAVFETATWMNSVVLGKTEVSLNLEGANELSMVNVQLLQKDGSIATNGTNIHSISIVGVSAQSLMKSIVYNGTLTFKTEAGNLLNVVEISVKKTLPAFDGKISIKDGLLVNGVVTVYPDTTNKYKLVNVFKEMASNIDLKNIGDYSVNTPLPTYNGNTIVTAEDAIVGNGVKYPTSASINYGPLVFGGIDWEPSWATPFAFEFRSVIQDSRMDWETEPKVYYNVGKDILLTDISFLDPYNTDIALAEAGYITGIEAHTFVSLDGGKTYTDNEDQYFTVAVRADKIVLTSQSGGAVPKGDLNSKISIEITDVFGKTYTKVLKYVMYEKL